MSPIYSERAAGIYRATYRGMIEKEMTNPDTQELEPRWIWRFQEVKDPTTVGEIDKITGTSMKSPNSNAYKMAAGIVGHKLAPGDDTEQFVGSLYDVVYGPNQAGNLTITSVVKVGTDQLAEAMPIPAAPAPVAAPVAAGALPELP